MDDVEPRVQVDLGVFVGLEILDTDAGNQGSNPGCRVYGSSTIL